jgi:hypothetical protein
VFGGGVDAIADLRHNPRSAGAKQLLVPEAGGRCEIREIGGKIALAFGSSALVGQQLSLLV